MKWLVFRADQFLVCPSRHTVFFFSWPAGGKARCTCDVTSFGVRSDTHVYNALVCHQKLTLEPWSHVFHLYMIHVEGVPPGGFDPRGGLSAVGLLQARAAPCGVNTRVSAAAAVLAAVSAAGNIKKEKCVMK